MSFIESDYTGNRYFKQRHIETILPALFRKVEINYTREQLDLPDSDFMDLDWIKNGKTKLMILFHGLEGSSDSGYIKGFAKTFMQLGWDVCAVNFRSCSGRMNNLKRSYHSGATEDVDAVLNYISSATKYEQVVLGGFSLGGNVLLKYLGEQKFQIPALVKAAFAFSVPCDLRASALQMAKWQNAVYMKRFLRSLNHKMKLKAAQFEDFPDISNLGSIKTFHQFDNRFNAPVHGFNSANDYYAQCNSLQFLPRIEIPTLLINAQNDPFLTPTCFPVQIAEQNQYLFLETPVFGGHVGFSDGWPNRTYWSERRIGAFLSSLSV
jgi:predicted alpha/beta-fold hydrolase